MFSLIQVFLWNEDQRTSQPPRMWLLSQNLPMTVPAGRHISVLSRSCLPFWLYASCSYLCKALECILLTNLDLTGFLYLEYSFPDMMASSEHWCEFLKNATWMSSIMSLQCFYFLGCLGFHCVCKQWERQREPMSLRVQVHIEHTHVEIRDQTQAVFSTSLPNTFETRCLNDQGLAPGIFQSPPPQSWITSLRYHIQHFCMDQEKKSP